MRDLVYISYSHRDKKFHQELREILDRDVRIRDILWDDTKIRKGANVNEEIAEHVARAKIMVMLVSPNYLDPDCSAWDDEIKPAMAARERGELIVLWIPVGAVRAAETPFPYIMAAGDVSRPLVRLRRAERQKALADVRAEIVRLIGEERSGQYDAFLSHNSKDKPAVREIALALKDRGLNVWLDEWVLPPGQPWQPELEKIIATTKAAIILVGPDGLGPWEEPEMRVCLDEFVRRRLPVIPVLLPGVEGEPELPLFLRQFTWVDLREGLSQHGLERLVWGVTGRGPASGVPGAETRETPRGETRRRETIEPVVRLRRKQMLALFALLAVLAAGALWIRLQAYRPADAEVAALKEICGLRGEVEPAASARIQSLDLSPCQVDDEQLRKWLAAIDTSELHTLDLTDAAISNAVLPEIAKLPRLTRLRLTRCRGIDATGLQHLTKLTSLEELLLDLGQFDEADRPQLGVVDAGLIYLQPLTALRVLDLSFTDAGESQRGLPCLSPLIDLTELKLVRTPIDDADLEMLSRFPKLRKLDLTGTRIADGGLKKVGQVRLLEELSLQKTEITKQGLDSLKGLTSLRRLNLMQTAVGPGDVEPLRQELKNKTGREIEILL